MSSLVIISEWWIEVFQSASGGSAGSRGAPFIELLLQQLLGGQVEGILFGVDVGVFGEGEFDDGLFGGFAEEEADGGVFVRELHLAVVVVHIHLHLAEVLMGELVELEVDEDVAAEEAVVEDEIDKVVVFIEGEASLAGFEEEALAHLEKEVLEAIDDGLLEVGLGVAGLRIEAEE